MFNKIKERHYLIDYRMRFRAPISYIPQNFYKEHIMFISHNSFQQTNRILSKQIRSYVIENIKNTNYTEKNTLLCIGGESYMYGLVNGNKIIHYTNSESIFNDSQFNNKIYKSDINSYLIDYNNFQISKKEYYKTAILNLSRLHVNTLNQLNRFAELEKIIIINCHSTNFWKSSKHLTNYQLVSRQSFICEKTNLWITVNIFQRNIFVSLGGNCSIAYQLQQNNLRQLAFPFDWSQITIDNLNLVLENNFKEFCDISIHRYSEAHSSYIIKNMYNSFAHEHFNQLKSRLPVRINRFKNLNNTLFPTFIRLETKNLSKETMTSKYLSLYKNLQKYIKKFKLIIISKNKPELNFSNIKFVFTDFCEDWKYPNIDWTSFLLFK